MKKNKKTPATALSPEKTKNTATPSLSPIYYNKFVHSEFRHSWLIVLIVLTCLMAYSVKIRFDGYRAWQKEPQRYFANADIPPMTTHDAYYWLKIAKDYSEGVYKIGKSRYPDFTQVPMISFVVSKLSPLFNNNLHQTAIFLTLILPGLFVIPLFLYFHKLGIPSAGILGSLIGTASLPYLSRTLAGAFDTDIMNLFFPFMGSFFILLAAHKKREYSYLFSALTGLTMLVFYWWYDKAGFTTIYFLVLIGYLVANSIDKKTLFYSALLYIIVANPVHLWQGLAQISGFFKFYVVGLAEAGELVFPRAVKTISEAGRLPFMNLMSWILRPGLLSLIGLVSFIAYSIFKWKKLLPLIPILSIGAMVFISSNRLAMYLVPFVGIGYGYLINAAFNKVFNKSAAHTLLKEVAIYGLSFLVFFLITVKTPTFFIPQPAVSAGVYKVFMELKDRLPKSSTIVLWWDSAYALQEATGFSTAIDGSGSQSSVKANFIAHGIISDGQRELYNILTLVTKENNEMNNLLNNTRTNTELITVLKNYNSPPVSDNIYLLFTEDLIGLTALDKYSGIKFLGEWGVQNQIDESGNFGNNLYNCLGTGKNDGLLKCKDQELDMVKGILNGGIPVKKLIVVEGANIKTKIDYDHKEGVYIEMLGDRLDNSTLNVFAVKVLTEKLYSTNINQMFLLGNYDRELFEDVYTSLPNARLFRVKVKK